MWFLNICNRCKKNTLYNKTYREGYRRLWIDELKTYCP